MSIFIEYIPKDLRIKLVERFPACVSFFKLCYFVSDKNFLKYLLCVIFCLCLKKNVNLLHFSVICFFYHAASINSVQATVVQFSTCCSSSLLFRLNFDNLSKKLIICTQHFDILVISNRPFTKVTPKFKPNSSPYTRLHPNTLLFETQEIFFSPRIFKQL